MRVAAILALCLGLAPLAGASAQTAGERCPRTPLAPRGDGAGGARYLNQPGGGRTARHHGTRRRPDRLSRRPLDRAHRLPASTLVPVPRLARTELLFEVDVTAVVPMP